MEVWASYSWTTSSLFQHNETNLSCSNRERKQLLPIPRLMTLVQAWRDASFSDLAKSSEDRQPQFCHPSCLCALSGWKISGSGISYPSTPVPPFFPPLTTTILHRHPCVQEIEREGVVEEMLRVRDSGEGVPRGVRLEAPLQIIFLSV